MTLVQDIMIQNPLTIRSDATIGEAVELFVKKQVGSLLVINEDGDLVGFLSDGDIIENVVRNVRKKNKQLNHIRSWYQVDCFQQYLKSVVNDPLYTCYTTHPYTVDVDETVKEASRLIQKKHLKVLPVLSDGKPVGVITRNSVMRGLFTQYIENPDAECVEKSQEDDF